MIEEETIEFAALEVRVSVAPFAATASPAALPEIVALPPGSYRVSGQVLRTDAAQSPTRAAEIVATVTFFATDAGGRSGPPPREEWRCVLKTAAGNLDARLSFNRDEAVGPGSTSTARIQLLSPELAGATFPLGADFELWEGKTVGRGKVFMHIPR